MLIGNVVFISLFVKSRPCLLAPDFYIHREREGGDINRHGEIERETIL